MLLFIDLDKFKNVNDRLGHAAGDKILQQVAERLSARIRIGDTACRYGGDEFVVMLPEIDGNESAATVIEKIRTHLATPYLLDDTIISVTASTGTTIYRTGQNCNDLIKQADIAMYFAKEHKQFRASPFNPTM
jgi:diguanylate cyclase (GGDEF)-like protein